MNQLIRTKILVFHSLTNERWDDFVELFGPHGAYGGCWCMFWRMTRKEFSQNCGENNKQAMKELLEAGTVPGIIGYLEGKPVHVVLHRPPGRFRLAGTFSYSQTVG